jgi:ABC-type Fe3+-siderophore transport system permease subunit
MQYLEDVLVPLGLFAMVVLIVWINRRMEDSKLKTLAETQRLLLEKFGSGTDLAAFLESSAGKSFLLPERKDLRKRVLGTITAGMILIFVGLGMIGLTRVENDLIIPGVISLSLGVGFLVAAAMSYYLSKKWGLLKEQNP